VSVEGVVGRVEAALATGAGSDELSGLLFRLEDRGQLDRLIGGLDHGDEVAERVESVLRLKGPVPASVDEIEEWGYAALEQWAGLALRHSPEGPVRDAFAALGDLAVEVLDQDEQSDDASFRLNGSLLGRPDDGDGDLSAEQLRLIHDNAFELLFDEIKQAQLGDGWGPVSDLFYDAVEDDKMLGCWLLSPAASWAFDFEPFYKLWRADVGLWVSPHLIEAVRGTAIRPDSAWGSASAPPEISAEDQAWLETAGAGGKKALSIIAKRGASKELRDLSLLSLPPAVVVEGGWCQLDLSGNPGLDPARVAELERVDILQLGRCELESFDVVLPAVKRLALGHNKLTQWPAGMADTGVHLVYLNLEYNQLRVIPDKTVAELRALEELNIHQNQIEAISPDIGLLANLKKVDLSYNALTEIPSTIGQLRKLERLGLLGNRSLTSLPETILELPASCRLNLKSTGLSEAQQKAKTVEQLREVW